MDMHTLLYLKCITNNDLLYSTWNSALCYVVAWMGGSFGENGCMYMDGWVPLLPTWNYHNIVNQIYPNTKQKVKKKYKIKTIFEKIKIYKLREPLFLHIIIFNGLEFKHICIHMLHIFSQEGVLCNE